MNDEHDGGSTGDLVPPPESAIEAFEAEQPSGRKALSAELVEATARRDRAVGWLMLVGFGPAALVAVLMAFFLEGSRELAIGFAALGAAVMALRAWRAHRDVQTLEKELADPMDGS